MNWIDLFVPGRVCILGEHSDWAASYRRINSEIEKGYAIVTGTNQGIYAKAIKSEDDIFYFSSVDNLGNKTSIEFPMNEQLLLLEAQKGGYSSYAAGVVYQILVHYNVGGIRINNYKTTLPVKKGLSSSAAISVLIVRAFNQIFNLKMNIRGEMEFAYKGELTTPSRCGRLDQGCAYGSGIINMTFDCDSVDVNKLYVRKDLNFVISDLKAGKDTVKILSDLNKAFPFPQTELERNVVKTLGSENKEINIRAIKAIQEGNKKDLGCIMTESQCIFDTFVAPACPEELKAPMLHSLLNDRYIKSITLGGKGVGSQGDGSVQFLVNDEKSQLKLIDYLDKNYALEGLPLDIPRTKTVKKAIITAAGFGTRLFPYSLFSRKELLPVIHDDMIKPLILTHIEHCIDSGIDEIFIIINDDDIPMKKLFRRLDSIYIKEKFSGNEYFNKLRKIQSRIRFIIQNEANGLGHAVLMAKDMICNEPFLLILGDHYFKNGDIPFFINKMIDNHEISNNSIIGLNYTELEDVNRFGCISGEFLDDNDMINIENVIEKPSKEYAKKSLTSINGKYLSFLGIYLFNSNIFSFIEELSRNKKNGDELQLTEAMSLQINSENIMGVISDIDKFDLGTPKSLLEYYIDYK